MDNLNMKYKQLYNQVKILRSKIYNLEYQREIVKSTIKEGVLINDNIIFSDELDKLQNYNNKIINELTNTIIPNINSKI